MNDDRMLCNIIRSGKLPINRTSFMINFITV